MTERIKNSELDPVQEDIYKTVDTVNLQLETLERFISRRFDELSMEINATSQQVDMAEDGMTKRFSEILEVLGAINYSGAGDTAANSGVELEAVIADTEKAANSILDAADRIVTHVDDSNDWSDPKVCDEMRENIKQDIQEILMACTFQDLTGQRIRNTLDNLHSIEDKLSQTFEKLGIEIAPNKESMEQKVQKAANQSQIDDIFDEEDDKKGDESASQGDIDAMFD